MRCVERLTWCDAQQAMGERIGMTATATDARALDEFTSVFADEASFRAWYDRMLPRIYAFIASRCGGPGPLAEELTQQTFIEATRRRDAFDGRSEVATWMCAIARHKLADHFRALEREERRRLRHVVREVPADGEPDAWLASDERDAIERALGTLPAAQRAALVFRHLDGLSVREIGALLGRSETAVESLLARAREGFRLAYGGPVR
jgi:RNA polymerase sigma-70 factor (ECF subfamily)